MKQENSLKQRIPLREFLEFLQDHTADNVDIENAEIKENTEAEETLIEAEQDATEAQATNETLGRSLASAIRSYSAKSQLVCKSKISEILAVENLSNDAVIEAMQTDDSCKDIWHITGKKDEYYYANPIMSHSFAGIAADIQEKNIVGSIENEVRSNYQRFDLPTPMYKFTMYPYYYTKVQIQNAVRQLLNEKKDISEYVTGNRKSYLYLNTEMSYNKAKALAEDAETDEWGEYRC